MITTLYNWKLEKKNCWPEVDNSFRIKIESKLPKIAEKNPNHKYRVPISLWLVLKNQRLTNSLNTALLYEVIASDSNRSKFIPNIKVNRI